MASRPLAYLAIALFGVAGASASAAEQWRTYAIEQSGLHVQIPTSLFTEETGTTDGSPGRVFFTRDHRADLTVKAVANPANDSPATFLRKMQPPDRIQYRRVTPDFFVVSSIRNGRIWYNRCNRAPDYMNCVLINYPAAESRQWDAIVTRISLSLGR